jgi:hypothetical protein
MNFKIVSELVKHPLYTRLLWNRVIFALLDINNQSINDNKSILIYFPIHLYNNISLCSIYKKKRKKNEIDKSEEVI